jgi:hypothetical protein
MRLVFLSLFFALVFSPFVHANEPNTQTLAWPDGTRNVGGLQDQIRQGQGTIYWQDGTIYESDFDRGRLIKSEAEIAPTLNLEVELLTLTAFNNNTIGAIITTLDLWVTA